MALYQNTKNGQIVEFIAHHDKDWAMIKNSTGAIQYIALVDLVSYEPGKGRTGEIPRPQSAESPVDEDTIPEAVIPMDTRLNINTASAEAIAKAVKGIGYSTAKKIVELRLSLSGERFSNLDQLKRIGRVDWDEVIGADLIYVG
jgi:competence ComEA-like helix-hairpin-helix protein